jgi:hypothetical protein
MNNSLREAKERFINNWQFIIPVLLCCLTALLLACWKLSDPGLYYDEMLFVNAAVGGRGDIFMRYKLAGIPILLMDYIGALKAWLYYPVFSIFPVNSWSVRLPAILIGLSGGMMLVAALWRGFGRFAALAGALMILLDPTLITHSRLDWGPNALMFFFRGLMILSVINLTKTLNPKWAWIALIALGLGIFDKLNFIWIGCAAIASTAVFYRDTLKIFANNYPRQSRLLLFFTATGVLASIARGIYVAESTQVGWGERITYAINLLQLTSCGGGALDFIAGNGLQLEKWIWPGYLAIAVFAVLGIKPLIANKDQRRLLLWTLTFLFLLAMAFIATKTATGPHHSSVLNGIWQFVLAALAGAAWDSTLQYRKLIKGLIVASLIFIVGGNIKANTICINAFAKPINKNWDKANFNAALFAKQDLNADYITADWGFGLQIIGATKDKPVILDVWPMFTNIPQAEEVITGLNREHDTYVYTRPPEVENFKGNRANLINTLNKFHFKHEISKTFTDWRGQTIVEIIRIPAAKQ